MELVPGGVGQVRQSEVIAALSHALDMTEGHPVGQAERSCLIGMRLAPSCGSTARPVRPLLRAAAQGRGLLVVGRAHVRAVRHRRHRAQDARQARRLDEARQVARYASRHVPAGGRHRTRAAHALGAALARRGGQGDRRDALRPRCRDRQRASASRTRAADAVCALDEYWDGRGQPEGLAGDAIPLMARIACLSQTAEVFFATQAWRRRSEMVRERRGRWFDPELADAFCCDRRRRPAVERSRSDDVAALVRELEPADASSCRRGGLDRICEAFADVIDAKSPYTARHSRGVATYARPDRRELGFAATDLRDLTAPGCCTTSASSAFRTRSSTSRAS